MSTNILSIGLLLAMATGVIAQPPAEPPQEPPKLGYQYRFVPNVGYRVLAVGEGTPAAEMGLRPGDAIFSINGRPLSHAGADMPARREAAEGDGEVRLRVRRGDTGRLVTLSTVLPGAFRGRTRLTEADNGRTVTVPVGARVHILLRGNPTTGYRWRTTAIRGQAVRLRGEPDYRPGAQPRGMVGGGGTFVFTVEAVQPGRSDLAFAYARPWETKAPERTYRVTIVVEDGEPGAGPPGRGVPAGPPPLVPTPPFQPPPPYQPGEWPGQLPGDWPGDWPSILEPR